MRTRALFAVMAALAWGCEPQQAPLPSPSASRAEAPRSPPRSSAGAPPAAPAPIAAVTDPNPLHLPPRKALLDPGKRVFAPSDAMLAGAKLGSSLVLYAATALGLDGDNVILEGRGGPSYKVQAGYVLPVPDDAKIRQGDAVLTEHAGAMKHAVVTKLVKDKTLVRFTDLDARAPETSLKHARFIRQIEGLAPGNYAALRDGEAWRHVMLISPFTEGGVKKWLALGFAGAAMKVDEAALRPVPIKWSPKVGATIWAENVGTFRRAVVVSTDELGLFTVKYERAGRPAVVGWGLVMKPIE